MARKKKAETKRKFTIDEPQYVVPGEVAFAIQSGRHELVGPAIARFAKEDMPREQVVGCLKAIRDLIKLGVKNQRKLDDVEALLDDMEQAIASADNAANEAREAYITMRDARNELASTLEGDDS